MLNREIHLLTALLLLASTALFAQKNTVSLQLTDLPHREPLNFNSGQTEIQICGLSAGNTYQVIALPASPDIQADYQLRLSEPGQDAAAQALSAADRPQLRRFVATSSCAVFLLETTPSKDPSAPAPSYLSIGCLDCVDVAMQKKQMVQNVADVAKLTVTQGNPANDLVTNVLIGGDCFDVSAISSRGENNSRGTFGNGQSSINISEGIILATGPATVLPGPNTLPNMSGGFGINSADDPHLATLTGGTNQYDVSIIEFDFKPTANTVQFDFVFGSEEYCEYVNSIYNDVFGFFISGPGIFGTKNLAVIPGTNPPVPVAINNVNHLKNSVYYRNNNNYGTCAGLPVTNIADIELDGFTSVLTATANVVPCETYHIKLAIADVGDANYSSAVFLRANSFNAGGRALADAVYPSTPTYTREGCANGYIRFYRGSGDLNMPLPINYSIDPASTATPGLDFDPLPASVVIPAGQTEILVPVNVLTDQLVEGSEFFRLLLDNSCSCEQQEITFNIEDQIPLDLNMADQLGCSGSATLTPELLAGGLPPLDYLWNDGQTSQSITSTTLGSTLYTVTVTDACGLSATISATAIVDVSPTAILSGDVTFCPGGSDQLTIDFTGNGPWIVAINANGTPLTQTFPQTPALYDVNQAGSYTLTAVSSQTGCPGLAGGTGTAVEVDLSVSLTTVDPLCFGGLGTIQSTVTSNSLPVTYSWDTGASTSELTSQPAGNYTLTVNTVQGCTAVASASLVEPTLLTAAINSTSNIDCYQPIGNAEVAVQGGTGSYQYQWSNGNQQSQASFSSGGTYTVTVSDANLCTATTEVSIIQNTTPPTVVATADDEINCSTPEVMLGSLGSSTGPNFVYAWSTVDGHIITSMEEPSAMVDAAGTYMLLITNTTNGCTASAQAIVTENTNYPTGFDLQIVDPGCNNKPGQVHILNVVGGEEPFVFSIDGGNTFLNQSAFQNLTAGQYSLVVQDMNGCEFTQDLELEGPAEPVLDLQPEIDLAYGESTEITALVNLPLSKLDTFIWSPGAGLTATTQPNVVLARPFKSSWYTVIVISEDGCTDEAKVLVRVGQPDIYVPNAIRPSSAQNNIFRLFARNNVINQVNQLQIFDRWGNLVFARDHFLPNDDRLNGWDGSYQGKVLEPGVFTWWANIELASGEQILLKGDVTIVD